MWSKRESKIGEIILFNGKRFKVRENCDSLCDKCYFNDKDECMKTPGFCHCDYRSDHKSIYYEKYDDLPDFIYANRMYKDLDDDKGAIIISDKKFTSSYTVYPLTIVYPYEFNNYKFQAKYNEEIYGEGATMELAIEEVLKSINKYVKFNYIESEEEYKSYEFLRENNKK